MLKINDLQFLYGDKIIFKELNLKFELGQIIGVLGENGVGKTTLFRIMSNTYNPKAGTLTWNSGPLEKSDVSFLPTDPFFYPYMNGQEYLSLVSNAVKEGQAQIANPFDLPLGNLIETYSTGMKKKLAFMGILSQRRDILILDEPFNGVDLQSNELLKLMIKKIKTNKSIIISSHIISTLIDTCDCIYYLGKNQLCQKYERSEFAQISELIRKESEERLRSMDGY